MTLATSVLLVAGLVASAATDGSPKKRRPLPQDYGRVVIQNHSAKAGLAPVVFDHWLHRARYTCRLCHVDIGFAMTVGGTDIRAADNMSRNFCGACHDGRKLFEACTNVTGPVANRQPCVRCHSTGKDVKPANDFATFAKGLPRGRFGNGVDWEKAEEQKLITPVDYLEGVSIKRAPLKSVKDFSLQMKLKGMPEIIFSHVKHTVWNGCELCHPDIFLGVARGATKYTMVEVFEGKYCGVCHTNVAFPLLDCQRCHSKPVQ